MTTPTQVGILRHVFNHGATIKLKWTTTDGQFVGEMDVLISKIPDAASLIAQDFTAFTNEALGGKRILVAPAGSVKP